MGRKCCVLSLSLAFCLQPHITFGPTLSFVIVVLVVVARILIIRTTGNHTKFNLVFAIFTIQLRARTRTHAHMTAFHGYYNQTIHIERENGKKLLFSSIYIYSSFQFVRWIEFSKCNYSNILRIPYFCGIHSWQSKFQCKRKKK